MVPQRPGPEHMLLGRRDHQRLPHPHVQPARRPGDGPVVHVIGAAVCNCPEPVTVALSSVGTVSVKSPVTVVVPFICKVPVPLNVDPLSSVTFPSVNVVPAATVKCPLEVSAVVTLRVPLCSSIVPVLVNRTQLPNANSPLPAVLRNVPALVKVGVVPHRLELKA